MLIYPNSMSFNIMEGGGVPPPPQGMLLIKVLRGTGLKGTELTSKIDPFVEVSIMRLLHVCLGTSCLVAHNRHCHRSFGISMQHAPD